MGRILSVAINLPAAASSADSLADSVDQAMQTTALKGLNLSKKMAALHCQRVKSVCYFCNNNIRKFCCGECQTVREKWLGAPACKWNLNMVPQAGGLHWHCNFQQDV